MGLRPGYCYSDPNKDRAYTRYSKSKPRKNFIGTSPALKIRQFNMGNPLKQYDTVIDFVTVSKSQIRDNALESLRININRRLANKIGAENYFMRLRVYPFHILRENKQAQGAGADRVSEGMSHSFGKPIGRAAKLNSNMPIFSVLTDEKFIGATKEVLDTVKSKLPCRTKIKVHKNIKSIGTIPKKMRIAEEKKEETDEEKKEETDEEKARAIAEEKKEAEKTGEKETLGKKDEKAKAAEEKKDRKK